MTIEKRPAFALGGVDWMRTLTGPADVVRTGAEVATGAAAIWCSVKS